MSFLEIEKLCKSYDGVEALRSCSLSLEQGEFMAVVGPSGCGKTTLLSLLAGLILHDSGQIEIRGRDISALPPEKRGIGMVFQHYALFPNLTVADNIAYGLSTARWTANRRVERLEEMLTLTGMTAFAHMKPAQLSGGQQQRVALARALALNPQLLLLDEPLSALDALHRLKLGEELRSIQRKSRVTAIMVTHDRAEALSLADKVAVMHDGQIEQIASPREIYENPVTPFVASFIGGMNILNLPTIRNGSPTGIRPEDVQLAMPTEKLLQTEHVWLGRVESERFRGQTIELKLLLNDFSTYVTAEITRQQYDDLSLSEQKFLAVILPQSRWSWWS